MFREPLQGVVVAGIVVAVLALAMGLLPVALAEAQVGKVYRIGYLGSTTPTTPEMAGLVEAFLQGMRDLGYIESQNITVERRFAEGRLERLPGLAAELVRLKVDVIFEGAPPAIAAAQQATRTIPIVMGFAGDPVATGFVASLARVVSENSAGPYPVTESGMRHGKIAS